MRVKNNSGLRNSEDVPPIDLNDFMERLPSKDLIKKLLDDFVGTYHEFIDEIKTSIMTGGEKEIRESTHKLKGVLANLSIKKGYTLTMDLEQNASTITKDEAFKILGEIEKELNRVKVYNERSRKFFA